MTGGCFERTGMLITIHALDEYDNKTKLQGTKQKIHSIFLKIVICWILLMMML